MLEQRRQGAFASLADFLRRTEFTAAERRALAATGALNALAAHRRAALWQVEAAWSENEALFKYYTAAPSPASGDSPLAPMSVAERLQADFSGLELTVGTHPMALARERLPDAWRASDLPLAADGSRITIAGSVICRQRPGTAKGVVFVSVEDETGIANAIVRPAVFERNRLVITQEPALKITGRLQNQSGVIHIMADVIEPLVELNLPAQASHDFR
jgi:error-prone DNA polymerase